MKQFFCSRWRSVRLASLFHENTVKNEDFLLSNALQFRYGSIVQKKKFDLTSDLIETYKKYTLIQPGDIMINGLNLNYDFITQRVALVPSTGIITSAYICLRPRNSVNYRFYTYYLKALDALKVFNGLGTGIRLTLSYDSIKNMVLPLPPREEQDQIVRYLDWQVSKINRLIAAKRKRIELVKEHFSVRIANIVCNGLKPNTPMRETGIDYIGAIPSHWTVLQNKRLFKSMNRTFQGIPTVLSLSQKDGLIPYSEMTERSLHTSSYENWQLVCPNDLVLNRFKAHLGVFFASKYTGIVTFHYGVYEAKMPLVAKYYEVLYHTPEYCRVYAGQSRGMTVGLQNLSDTNFYSTYTVYPPNEEQREIVTEIEQIEKQQSSIIAGVNRQIEKLQEFRTRLISDVVTGQVDVRGIKVPDDEYINNEITEEEFEEESENNEEE